MAADCSAFWVMYCSILWLGDTCVLWCFFQRVLPIGVARIRCTAARSQIVCWPSFCRSFPRILRGRKWVSRDIKVFFGNGQFFHCLHWILKVSSYYISATFSEFPCLLGGMTKLWEFITWYQYDAIVRAVNATQYYQGFLFRSVASLGFRYLFSL